MHLDASRDATECIHTAQHHTYLACAGQSDVVDEEGQASPVISWSDLHVLYQLPDGTKWAEHGNFYDCEDLVSVQNTMPILFGICSSLYASHCALLCLGNLHVLLVSQD